MWGQEGIARGLGAGERFKGGACEVLAGFEDAAFEFSNAVGVCGFLFQGLEDGLHVFVKVGHVQSLQVPICGCTLDALCAFTSLKTAVCCYSRWSPKFEKKRQPLCNSLY